MYDKTSNQTKLNSSKHSMNPSFVVKTEQNCIANCSRSFENLFKVHLFNFTCSRDRDTRLELLGSGMVEEAWFNTAILTDLKDLKHEI